MAADITCSAGDQNGHSRTHLRYPPLDTFLDIQHLPFSIRRLPLRRVRGASAKSEHAYKLPKRLFDPNREHQNHVMPTPTTMALMRAPLSMISMLGV